MPPWKTRRRVRVENEPLDIPCFGVLGQQRQAAGTGAHPAARTSHGSPLEKIARFSPYANQPGESERSRLPPTWPSRQEREPRRAEANIQLAERNDEQVVNKKRSGMGAS